jgi:hypothetical protein
LAHRVWFSAIKFLRTSSAQKPQLQQQQADKQGQNEIKHDVDLHSGRDVMQGRAKSNVTFDGKSAMSLGGAIGAPSTAWAFDFNILPLGQQLWLKHLETFKQFPPLQAPETFNLDHVLQQVKSADTHPSD